jgi:excisionase family DNA binding protein
MRDLSTIEPLAYSPDAAGRRLGVSLRQVYHLISVGEVRSTKSGKRRLIPDEELKSYLKRRLAETAKA